MSGPWSLALLGLAYLGLLFAIAWYGDREAARGRHPVPRPVVYTLSLAVYCTSWAFYGTAGQSAELGWWLPPTYVGTIVLFLLGWKFLHKLVRISRRQRITSVADFLGARYGRDRAIAAFVTVIATLGLIPYISLQLKAIDISFVALAGRGLEGEGWAADTGLWVTLVLAAFTILFGARHADATEHHPGMMLALAFESLVKLLAFLAVGAFVVFGMHGGFGDVAARVAADAGIQALRAQEHPAGHYLALCVLGFFAIFCLPRQFHVAVVENSGPADLQLARWAFPLYLVAISLFVLPIANAGLLTFGPTLDRADLYTLRLPLHADQPLLALLVFLGGLSAATGMVIVACVALATMLSNEIAMPALLRASSRLRRRPDLTPVLIAVRRLSIVLLLAAAYVYYRLIAAGDALAQIGEISMAAVAVFGPPVIAGAYWREATRAGALAGLVLGFVAWGWTLLLPTLVSAGYAPGALLAAGPGGLEWLRPTALFGFEGWNSLAHGLFWLLLASTLGLVAGSLLSHRSLLERIQAAVFVDAAGRPDETEYRSVRQAITLRELRALAEQFVGAARARAHFAELGATGNGGARASAAQVASVQRLLGSVIGAASAQRVLDAAISGRELEIEDVVSIVGGASQALEFSRELLQATLENVDQGISVVDAELRLVAWNRRYLELFRLPSDEVRIGRPIEEILRYNAARGELGAGDPEEQIAKRLAHLRRRTPYVYQRVRSDGTVIEIRGQPMPGPGGGVVTSYTDVTDYVKAQRALQDANESLERRVRERTRALSALNEELLVAKAAAERANQSKTRFLAAASHDLLQPLNAAGLFAGALAQKVEGSPRALVDDLEQCLRAAEGVLTDLLDISKLDAGAVQPSPADVALGDVLGALESEFGLQSRAKGLQLKVRRTALVARTDPRLLRRILQNFLANAVRYTERGRIVVGCRRTAGRVRIEVWDTGPGIADDQRSRIFEEFYRVRAGEEAPGAATPGRGFGLGLAIVERIARVLDALVAVRSWPGRGSAFSVEVPRGERAPARIAEPAAAPALGRLRVLVVDNDASAMRAMAVLLESWGCDVAAVHDESALPDREWLAGLDLLVVDYHLDDGATGTDVASRLRVRLGRELPVLLVTADGAESTRAEAESLGALYLRKPVKPLALRSVLRRLTDADARRRAGVA
ncbi:MAG: NahK/ErcS family hybrid sensor histidine kinase/response regulator [Pseudomonadota bacterium]